MSPTFLARIRPNGPDASASGRKSIGSAKSRRPNEQAVVEVLVRPTRAELRRASADAAERLAAGRTDADATTAGAGSVIRVLPEGGVLRAGAIASPSTSPPGNP